MRRHFFITGTDTGVGKTTLGCLDSARRWTPFIVKPIQTGTLEGSDPRHVMRLCGHRH